ncbi:hypothetical protein HY008_01480 [Candidatus Woesebacteria bacterium]|nr:hypothetical protein [Candidatus Woesebacteria bacterium]
MLERLFDGTKKIINPQELILRYLASGSIEEANQELPQGKQVTEGVYRKVLQDWGIVEYVGPERQYPEILYLLSELATRKVSLGSIYVRRPLIFEVSFKTFKDVVNRIREGTVLRAATALVLSPENDSKSIVVGEDFSVPREELGKLKGAFTVPECFSRPKEDPRASILRVFQREVFANLAAERKFNLGMVLMDRTPIGYVDVADVRVTCYRGTIPNELMGELSSPTILRLGTRRLEDILSLRKGRLVRAGLPETITEYQRFLTSSSNFEPRVVTSQLNSEITQMPIRMAPNWKLA